MQPETKGIITDIANGFIKIFQIDRFSEMVSEFVSKEYRRGANQIEKQLNFNVDLVNQERDIGLLGKYVSDNIKGMTDQMQDRLRQELQRGLMNNENPKQIRKRIAAIFRGNNPTRFRYEDRIKMIARTESVRASNMAKFENAKRLGRPLKKYLLVKLDSRTSQICKNELSKYGTDDQAIPLEKDFIVTVGGKTYREPYPPFHVNCRTAVAIIQEEN